MDMITKTKSWLFFLAGALSLGLGVVGAFLPVLPTTPLLILAAFFFSKSSPRMHQWVLNRPGVGPMVREWQDHRVIRIRGKILSTALIIPLFAYTLGFTSLPLTVKSILGTVAVMVLWFIWSRPSTPHVQGPITGLHSLHQAENPQ